MTQPIGTSAANQEAEAVELDLSSTFRDAKARIVSEWERGYLGKLMSHHGGNVSKAARSVKMSRNYLTELLQRHRVEIVD